MSIAEKMDPSKLSNFYTAYLRFVGLWLPPKTQRSPYYTAYALTFLFVFSFWYTLCMVVNIFLLSNVADMTTVLFMSLNEVSLFIKVVYFFMQNRKIQQLMGKLNEFDVENADERKLISDRIAFFWKVNLFYYIIANWATSTTEVASLFADETMLPFPGWYPGLDWQHNRTHYWIVFIYQCTGMCITCNMSMSVDMYPCFFLYMISVELSILGRRIRALGHEHNEKRNDDDQDEHEGNQQRRPTMDATKYLIRIIQRHQDILQYAETFESYFTMSFLSLIAISGTVICSMANELSRVSHKHTDTYIIRLDLYGANQLTLFPDTIQTSFADQPFQYIAYLTFVGALLTQIFLPCYFGNALIVESEEMNTYVYGSNWMDLTRRNRNIKQLLLVFTERLQRKTQILVGVMFPMSLDTFTRASSLIQKKKKKIRRR